MSFFIKKVSWPQRKVIKIRQVLFASLAMSGDSLLQEEPYRYWSRKDEGIFQPMKLDKTFVDLLTNDSPQYPILNTGLWVYIIRRI